MSQIESIPQKPFYRINEVCQLTDTQPYVLHFWESEFPQLSPDRSSGGQPVYRREDIGVVLRIKELLYDDECTIEEARKQLEQEQRSGAGARPRAAARPAPEKKRGPRPAAAMAAERSRLPITEPAPGAVVDMVPRSRYVDAVDEIQSLRLQMQEAEGRAARAESSARQDRERADRAISRLEPLLRRLEPPANDDA